MPGRPTSKHGKRAQGSRGASKPTNSRLPFVKMGMAGTSAADEFVRSDLSLRPVASAYTASPPRNLSSKIWWVRANTQQVVTTSTTVVTENNISFTANPFLTQYASWLALFDQYFLDHVVVTVANNSPEGGTAACPQLYTAIDFDNVSALGTLAAISQFNTCHVSTLAPGNSVTRLVRPCNASYLGANATAGVTRSWVDSTFNGVPFYGYRLIVNNTVAATVQLDVTISCLWAFRNTI